MSLFIILLRHNYHLLTSNGFGLLCNVCYWNFLQIVFVVSLHHQALISCGAKCYFSKLAYQLLLVQCFWNKLKTNFHQKSFLIPKMSHFFSEWVWSFSLESKLGGHHNLLLHHFSLNQQDLIQKGQILSSQFVDSYDALIDKKSKPFVLKKV